MWNRPDGFLRWSDWLVSSSFRITTPCARQPRPKSDLADTQLGTNAAEWAEMSRAESGNSDRCAAACPREVGEYEIAPIDSVKKARSG